MHMNIFRCEHKSSMSISVEKYRNNDSWGEIRVRHGSSWKINAKAQLYSLKLCLAKPYVSDQIFTTEDYTFWFWMHFFDSPCVIPTVTILNYLVISFKLLQKRNKCFEGRVSYNYIHIIILLLDSLSNAWRAAPRDHGEQRIRGIVSQNKQNGQLVKHLSNCN